MNNKSQIQNNGQHRYPGSRPFGITERDLFFGRDSDAYRLIRLIEIEKLVVLHSKSGYGKSSLLRAAVFPAITAEGNAEYWEIRLGVYSPQFHSDETILTRVIKSILPKEGNGEIMEKSGLSKHSIWYALKTNQEKSEKSFILFFDQFEDLFTYPVNQVQEFINSLSDSLFSIVPKKHEAELYKLQTIETSTALNASTAEDFIYKPIDLRVVFSVRSDKISQLFALQDYLPGILQHTYKLEALDVAEAINAIVKPAALNSDKAFFTKPFFYSKDLLNNIILSIKTEDNHIEPSILQIICWYVENKIVPFKAQSEILEINLEDIQDPKEVFNSFYLSILEDMNESDRFATNYLLENFLIKDGLRLPFAEQVLVSMPGVTIDLLNYLVGISLLRRELDMNGRLLYEISHDMLIEPITKAANSRKIQEQKLKDQQEIQRHREIAISAARKQRRSWLLSLGAVLLALSAFIGMALAIRQSNKLEAATDEITKGLLKEIDVHLGEVKYEVALQKAMEAVKLDMQKKALADRLFELTYFFNESGDKAHAVEAFQLTTDLRVYDIGSNAKSILLFDTSRSSLRQLLQQLNENLLRDLDLKYYPKMIELPEGTFTMGCQSTIDQNCQDEEICIGHDATVSLHPFQIAEAETSIWQYSLYCKATGVNINKYSPDWGLSGDNPITNVDWYDAILYCNWLSLQTGRAPAYEIDSTQGEHEKWLVHFVPGTNGYRLPTEAEWEYAAHGGASQPPTLYSGGNDSKAFWQKELCEQAGIYRTHSTKAFPSNSLGLFDLSGNAWEWCWNGYLPYPFKLKMDTADVLRDNDERILRGGSFQVGPELCRITFRFLQPPDTKNEAFGFRIVSQQKNN